MIVREATSADGARVAELIGELGHDATAEDVAARLPLLELPQLVVESDGVVVGLCGLAATRHIHRATPVGRITIMVVDSAHRGQGIGRALVDEAERRLRDAGCALVEVTSNHRFADAHRFYAHLGYDQPSLRFAKKL